MKSVLFSRFFILLPWILIVIIMLDVDTRRPAPPLTPRPYFSPYVVGRGGARLPLRRGGPDSSPGRGWQKRNESRPQARPRPEPPLPTIYAITPTYSRPVQKAELTRLANTFRQVAQLHWILVEDAAARSELVSRFLARAGLPSTHLHVPTPRRYKRPGLPRATEQRNAGLAWLRQRHQHQRAQPGVLFFADDDNTYSLELFQEVAAGPPQLGRGAGGSGGAQEGLRGRPGCGCTCEFSLFRTPIRDYRWSAPRGQPAASPGPGVFTLALGVESGREDRCGSREGVCDQGLRSPPGLEIEPRE